ncbi:phasin family protein [Bradyrhizobium sp. CCBAU 051011]|uniref:phasin family protein n=1 Tax=Bradyrhizobium sp. CCBAU 051011 TaxID=858422 RepID=UPI001373C169|nr:phasin family protein [Bradyrhizobium sp. CCBAU 051011]QHO75979.1 phasin family protein [Bradyrhizobium sp. CCBAU 051011]
MSNDHQNNANRTLPQQIDSVNESMKSVPAGLHAIATAYTDYSATSFEDIRLFVEKLSGVKSVDKAIELQSEFAKSSFETFMAESQKIGALYRDLAMQSYKPFSGLLAKMTPTNR